MPLLDIAGSTACNKTFSAGFGLIANEKEESYGFLLGCLLALMEKTGIRHPMTILTDKELNLMRAIQCHGLGIVDNNESIFLSRLL